MLSIDILRIIIGIIAIMLAIIPIIKILGSMKMIKGEKVTKDDIVKKVTRDYPIMIISAIAAFVLYIILLFI